MGVNPVNWNFFSANALDSRQATRHPMSSTSSATSGPLISDASPSRYPVFSLGLIGLALALMYIPTFSRLAETVWATDEQGHGPIILAAVAWLLWGMRASLFRPDAQPAVWPGLGLLAVAVVTYTLGHSQSSIELEAGSLLLTMPACVLLLTGTAGLRKAWFPLLFLFFLVPLPSALVQSLTMPLKSAVSVVAENLLFWAGYPIGRSGVTLTVGPYQLLVADACSGLNSLFTLEALGFLYMNLMNYTSRSRNTILALCIVPISFASNVIRVIILVLVTYYLGDEAGQGFIHGFAGMVLFSVALVLTYGLDRLLASRFDDMGGQRERR
jgi:exosortase B